MVTVFDDRILPLNITVLRLWEH